MSLKGQKSADRKLTRFYNSITSRKLFRFLGGKMCQLKSLTRVFMHCLQNNQYVLFIGVARKRRSV